MGIQHASLDAAIQGAGNSASLINTKNCEPTCRNLKSCNYAQYAVTKAASAGEAATDIQIPASHRDVFYNLPVKLMWPFKNATALHNTIYMETTK